MTYDVAIIGAGLGGLTAAALLARAGKKVLLIERSNSVGGAASSYKVGDLFVEGSLHETSNPLSAGDVKRDILARAGVLDAVRWIPTGALTEVRGGPLDAPFVLPDDTAKARAALVARFPQAREAINRFVAELAAADTGASNDITLSDRLTEIFGDDETIKCAVAGNLWYTHDDSTTLSWAVFAHTQGAMLAHGACFIEGGSQRLSSALARAVRAAGGEVTIRRVVTSVTPAADGAPASLTHTAKDGNDPKTAAARCVIGAASPDALAAMLPPAPAAALRQHAAGRTPSISLFALTLGLSKPPKTFGVSSYATQILPSWMTRLSEYALGQGLMADEPGTRMPPLSIVDYSAIVSGIPMPPHVLSVIGPDALSNWNGNDMDAYRDKRARWQDAIVRHLDAIYPGLAGAVVASSFNTALSVSQYLNAPTAAVYGYAPLAGIAPPTPHTAVPGFYLASNYGGAGGYNGAIAAGAACADMILDDVNEG